jgi:hypothetical protein
VRSPAAPRNGARPTRNMPCPQTPGANLRFALGFAPPAFASPGVSAVRHRAPVNEPAPSHQIARKKYSPIVLKPSRNSTIVSAG